MKMIDLPPVRIARGLLARYGPTSMKAKLWDKEYIEGSWDRIDNTVNDPVYSHLATWTRKGRVLDLGCGPGNTANEMPNDSYSGYVGLDISEAACEKGRKRSEANGRGKKNTFVQGDFLTFQPPGKFDLILMREAMYHVPSNGVAPLLQRLSQHLNADGVFVVRMCLERDNGEPHPRLMGMVDVIEATYDVVEKKNYGRPGATVIVFRPKGRRN
jgi:SAM-dependent methyltransferase